MFSDTSNKIRDAAKLLTAAVALDTKPNLKAGIDVYDAAKALAGKPTKGLKGLFDFAGNPG